MKADKNAVIAKAKSYDGYIEKKSNAQLDDFTANAGSANFTRFGRDYDAIMGTHLNGSPYCAMYLSMMFVEAYGLDNAKKLLGGNLFAYTPTGAQQMGAKKGIAPKAGDVVFFYSNSMKRISHVGLVTAVDSKYFYTVEGNTSGGTNTVVRNGGGVHQKKYSLGYSSAYFATPKYDSVELPDPVPEKKEYGTETKPKKYSNLRTTFLRSEPKAGNASKVKYEDLSAAMKDKCSEDKDGWAKFLADKAFIRTRKFTDGNGNKWFGLKSGYWLPALYRNDIRVGP